MTPEKNDRPNQDTGQAWVGSEEDDDDSRDGYPVGLAATSAPAVSTLEMNQENERSRQYDRMTALLHESRFPLDEIRAFIAQDSAAILQLIAEGGYPADQIAVLQGDRDALMDYLASKERTS